MDNPSNPADGKFVVIENGQRVTAPTANQAEAAAEAARRNKITEATQPSVPESKRAAVKQNLMG